MRSGIRRTTSRPGTCSAFWGGERGELDLGDLGAGDPPAGVFVEDGVGVLDRGPGLVADRGDRGLDGGVRAHGDAHVGAARRAQTTVG